MVSMTRGSAPMVKAKLAPKAWAERSRLPRLTAFETPSMPMAKKPRGLAGGDFTARLCHKRRLAGQASEGKETAHARGAIQRVRRTGEASHRRGPGSDASRGEIIIRVAAVGLNFFDTLQLRNRYQVTPTLPHSPGGEVAGTVEALGPGVSGLALGQRVLALIGGNGCREKVTIKAKQRRSDSRWGQR